MSYAINIVSFDVPFPANYGGVIDVFYKLHWLKKAGVKIHLHCFSYGRNPSKELEDLCEKVYYYPRKTGLAAHFSLLPYTVKSRQNKELEKNLLSNDFPILFEVLHTCYLLNDSRFKQRKKIYRHSNIEHTYYQELSRSEKSFVKKIYLQGEAWKLKRFEKIIRHANLILAVNQKDTTYFRNNYSGVPAVYLPSFHPAGEVSIQTGKGDYALFHGNLSVSENYEAAVWLIEKVFSKTKFPVIIAGLKPPAFIAELIRNYPHIKLISSPADEEMTALIRNAQLHVLYTSQATGLKLKLLNVLFKGRFVVCNNHMVSGTGLRANSGLLLTDTAEDFINTLNSSSDTAFSEGDLAARKTLTRNFDNALNAQKFIETVFN